MIKLQAGGDCYSWRLPPPRWLGGGLVEAHKEDCTVLWRSDCEGYCARPTGAAKEQLLVERVIELPSLSG